MKKSKKKSRRTKAIPVSFPAKQRDGSVRKALFGGKALGDDALEFNKALRVDSQNGDPRNDRNLSGRDLTEAQDQAAEPAEQNVLVSAGAGTGKTSVLVERYLRIIVKGLAAPNEILAITFMEKAANEMKKRVVDGLRSLGLDQARREIENAYIGTIHAFCARILREHPLEAGIDPQFRVLKEDEADLLKETVLDQLIEDRFIADPAVRELLGVYGERGIRDGIESVYDKMRMYGLTLGRLFSEEAAARGDELKEDLLKVLRDLHIFSSKREKAEAAIEFLNVPHSCDWLWVQEMKQVQKTFDARGKEGREETKQVKERFGKFIGYHIEKLGAAHKRSFLDLLREFDLGYRSAKHEHAGFDFTDLQLKAIELLGSGEATSEAIRERYRLQFKFIMVDEFQDTDPVQVRLLDLLKCENNLFLVGDFKQSIYGFRGSEPVFFREKEKEFTGGGKGIGLSLHENFRSRKELLDFINPFFETLWEGTEPAYEALLPKAEFQTKIELPVDLILIEKEKSETLKMARPEEARNVAERIRELVEKEGYHYRDFAILFRASETMSFYEQELRELQIPYYVLGGIGFYNRPEIRDLTNFLLTLENPMRDIPFAALMRSPMFLVSDDVLFWLCRHAMKEENPKSIFTQIAHLEEIAEISDENKSRLTRFKTIFENLLRSKGNGTVAEMLEKILIETGYDLYVLGSPQGKRRFANIRKLIDLAREIEARDGIHFGDFVRYVKGLEAEEVRESEAQVEAEDDDAVKLLTIHKAKGLEFRCVVLPDLGRGKAPAERGFLLDLKLGLGMKVYNPEEDDFEKTLTYNLIVEARDCRQSEESKRLLYVAMTRAKERLMFAGITAIDREAKENSENWLDWVKSVIENKGLEVRRSVSDIHRRHGHKRKRALVEKKNFRARIEHFNSFSLKDPSEETQALVERFRPHKGVFFDRIDLPVSAYLLFAKETGRESYRRVYELGAADRPFEVKDEEVLLAEIEEVSSPADIGTLVHKVFERLVRKKTRDLKYVRETVHFYTEDSPALAADVLKMAETFVQSGFFEELLRAKRIFSELPFSLRLKRGIVHGVLDLLFQNEAGEWLIVDYKTSNIGKSEIETTGERYREQMELYALASVKILNQMPEKAVLYFVRPDERYEIGLEVLDAEQLENRYELLQEDIIRFRKELVNEPLR